MKRFSALFLILFLAAPALAEINLKPGPQLWVYSAKGDIESVRSMVEYNSMDKEVLGRAMYHTLRRGQGVSAEDTVSILRLMISHGADVNYKTMNGQTPLMAAVIAKNIEAARLLLENGADSGIVDHRSKKAADYASGPGAKDLVAAINNPPPLKKLEVVKPDLSPKILNLDLTPQGQTVAMTFDLVAPGPTCVRIIGSMDKGATYGMKFRGAKGDLGRNVIPGSGKKILWNSAMDYPDGIADLDIILDVVAEKCD